MTLTRTAVVLATLLIAAPASAMTIIELFRATYAVMCVDPDYQGDIPEITARDAPTWEDAIIAAADELGVDHTVALDRMRTCPRKFGHVNADGS